MTQSYDSSLSLTELIHAWSEGVSGASDALAELVYSELHRIASVQLQKERQARLEPAELVHEVWMRLGGDFPSRQHFFAFAALQMRRFLIDCARASKADKRYGDRQTITVNLADACAQPTELVVLMEALEQLEQLDARKAEIFSMVRFLGFGLNEVAEMTGLSRTTVERDLRFSRTWLAARVQ